MSTPTTFWRLAGMTYMGYVTRATSALRGGLKEPARTKAFAGQSFSYNRSTFADAVQSGKTEITKLATAGK
ncbi:hypothetical protein TrLO_g1420 [Triparma laevis f. longispina]|uniref:Uncharacterized protein n=1 Tax=Triparma laevis f. longispina TaxID=1714387 RepID=A0A9W7FQ80_9STRA|nr:hypothetical protein TrLO_g1420 [Triparma laevis f. longispina]